jgi:gliding motility-associated lipoprotein GldH
VIKNSIQYFVLTALFAILFLTGCDSGRYFEEYKEVPKGIWNKDIPLTFEVDIKDTITSFDFYINLRHSTEYPYSNIFLLLHTTFPHHKFAKDTVELLLADPSGAWYGSGAGSLRDNNVLLKRNIRFPFTGIYKFELYQAMRVDDLPFVTDAGIRIEKHKKKDEK